MHVSGDRQEVIHPKQQKTRPITCV